MIVVLVIADSVRFDAPGFGGGPARTPALDRLAREGTFFTEAVASGGWTVPSLVSMATGTFPHRVGVSRWRHPFPRRRPTLMSAFAAAGFEVRTVVHNPRFCLASTAARGTVGDSERPDEVLDALRTPAGSDRFVLVHHWWTHLPYRNEKIPRKPWKRLCDEAIAELARDPQDAVPRMRDEYHSTLSWFDQELLPGYLEAASSGGQDVLFAFTGDHGETWGDSLPPGARMEHIYDLHGRWLSDETTRVPLLFWGGARSRGVPAGGSLSGFARGVDLAPTLCELAGVPWPGPIPQDEGPTLIDRKIGERGEGLLLDGVSMAPSIDSGVDLERRSALTVTSHNAIVPARYPRSGRRMWSRYGLRTADRRYVWDGLFGLRSAQELDGTPAAKGWSGLRERWLELPSTWSELAEERRGALGPGERLPKELYPRFSAPGSGGEDQEEADGGLEDALRMLGYEAG